MLSKVYCSLDSIRYSHLVITDATSSPLQRVYFDHGVCNEPTVSLYVSPSQHNEVWKNFAASAEGVAFSSVEETFRTLCSGINLLHLLHVQIALICARLCRVLINLLITLLCRQQDFDDLIFKKGTDHVCDQLWYELLFVRLFLRSLQEASLCSQVN